MIIEEKQLKRLNKGELIHLLTEIVGLGKLNENWQKIREYQTTNTHLNCWDCESIANKLSNS